MTEMRAGGSVAIVAYRSLIDGVPDGCLDIQAKWFAETDAAAVRSLIENEPFSSYANPYGETVCWELVQIFAVEPFAPRASGDEVAGFIAKMDELADLVN